MAMAVVMARHQLKGNFRLLGYRAVRHCSNGEKQGSDEWKNAKTVILRRRRSISPISRLVQIIPEDQLTGDKDSLAKLGQSPPTKNDMKGESQQPNSKSDENSNNSEAEVPVRGLPPRRKRVSVTDRINLMMSDTNAEDPKGPTTN